MNKIDYSPRALQDMDDIWDYIAQELKNPIAAKRTIDRITTDISRLKLSPLSGPPCPLSHPSTATSGSWCRETTWFFIRWVMVLLPFPVSSMAAGTTPSCSLGVPVFQKMKNEELPGGVWPPVFLYRIITVFSLSQPFSLIFFLPTSQSLTDFSPTPASSANAFRLNPNLSRAHRIWSAGPS